MSLVKAAVFGAVLAAVSCYHGFTVKGGAREVGSAVTRSVVISVIGILFFNYILTAWLS
jgi:phospholipid/cholesterol/gamma-HCH transport system permease protein